MSEMAEEPEEVRRVTDALEAIDRIEDPEERIRARSRIMAAQVKLNQTWGRERAEMILHLHDEGVSYRKIASRLGTSLSVVQDVIRGYTGSGKHRPRSKDSDAE